jgi:hypothetical protein
MILIAIAALAILGGVIIANAPSGPAPNPPAQEQQQQRR